MAISCIAHIHEIISPPNMNDRVKISHSFMFVGNPSPTPFPSTSTSSLQKQEIQELYQTLLNNMFA